MHFNRISNNLIFKLYRQCTVTGKGVRCMLVSRSVCSVVCCLVTDWFSRSRVSGHLSRRATAGCPRDAGLADKTPQRSGVKTWHQAGGMSQMSKSSSSQVRIQVAARFTVLHYLVAPRPWHNLCCTCVRTMRAEFTTQENWINVFSWPLFRPILVSIYNWYLWRANT